jgi:hypothetical protein
MDSPKNHVPNHQSATYIKFKVNIGDGLLVTVALQTFPAKFNGNSIIFRFLFKK